MKRISLVISLTILSILTGCEKLNELITFNIKNETEVNIPSQSGLNIPFVLRSPEVKTSSEQTFKNNNTRADLVESALLSELKLTITAPENQDFNFLNEISLYIKDGDGNEELIAFKKNIPEDGSQVLLLESTGINLKPYVQKDAYSLRSEVKTDQVVNNQVDIKINMTFKVKAKIF